MVKSADLVLCHRCQLLASWLSRHDWWQACVFCPFLPQQSQWGDCSGSNKSQGWERSSPCGAPEGTDEGGVFGEGPSAEGTRGGMSYPGDLWFSFSAVAPSSWVWVKEPCLFAQTLQSTYWNGDKGGERQWDLPTGRAEGKLHSRKLSRPKA